MNKVEELIRQLCPEGVEYKRLDELEIFMVGLLAKAKTTFKMAMQSL